MNAINLRVSESRKLRILKTSRKLEAEKKAAAEVKRKAMKESQEAYRSLLGDHISHVRMYCAVNSLDRLGHHFGGLHQAALGSGDSWWDFIHREEYRQKEYRVQAEIVKSLHRKEQIHAKHFVSVDSPEVTPSVPLTAAIVTLVVLFVVYLASNI